MLNDANCDGTNTYSTQRLEDLLITSAYFLPIDINFSSDYVIDVSAYTVTPDPVDQADGKDFISFMVLKAACMADEGAFRNAALLQGVSARLGPTSIQTSSYGVQLSLLLNEGPCKSFEELKKAYNFSYEGKKIIRAVMSPFVSNDFDPSAQGGGQGMLDTSNLHRDRD